MLPLVLQCSEWLMCYVAFLALSLTVRLNLAAAERKTAMDEDDKGAAADEGEKNLSTTQLNKLIRVGLSACSITKPSSCLIVCLS